MAYLPHEKETSVQALIDLIHADQLEAGARLPGEAVLYPDRDGGELRLWVREDRTWHDGCDGARGRWVLQARAVLDAWGSRGTGLRALLDGPALLRLLDRLAEESGLSRDDGRLQDGAGAADHAV